MPTFGLTSQVEFIFNVISCQFVQLSLRFFFLTCDFSGVCQNFKPTLPQRLSAMLGMGGISDDFLVLLAMPHWHR